MAEVSHHVSRTVYHKFAVTGTCRDGNRCRFSHDAMGMATRPPPERIPSFNWEDTGTCPYGARCVYLHRSRALVGSTPLEKLLLDTVCEFERPSQFVALTYVLHLQSLFMSFACFPHALSCRYLASTRLASSRGQLDSWVPSMNLCIHCACRAFGAACRASVQQHPTA